MRVEFFCPSDGFFPLGPGGCYSQYWTCVSGKSYLSVGCFYYYYSHFCIVSIELLINYPLELSRNQHLRPGSNKMHSLWGILLRIIWYQIQVSSYFKTPINLIIFVWIFFLAFCAQVMVNIKCNSSAFKVATTFKRVQAKGIV